MTTPEHQPTAEDFARIDRLYQMALDTHTGPAHPTLRATARDGIRAEMEKQPGLVEWLREHRQLAIEPFEAAGHWLVPIRDTTYAAGGMRGSFARTVHEAAASAIVDHLAQMVAHAFVEVTP